MINKTLSLVIPCYNEEKTICQLVETVIQVLNEHISLELVIVDDCSTDSSYAEIQKIKEKYPQIIKVLKQEVNKGKGAALHLGLMSASGDYIGIQDADMEYNPMDYLELVKYLEKDVADVVYGSRYLRRSNRRALYFWHTLMNKTLTFFSNTFTNIDITDMETCYKLFKKDVIHNIVPQLKENRFGFEPEVTQYVALGQYRVYECAIEYNPRSYEEGKKINWKDGVRALYCIVKYGAPYAPLPMQLLLYLLIGSISAVFNIIAFAILFNLLSIPLSQFFAYCVGAVVNYFLCITLLFHCKGKWASVKRFLLYCWVVLLMCSFDFIITISLIYINCSPITSKTIAAFLGVFGNFILRKYIVFKK